MENINVENIVTEITDVLSTRLARFVKDVSDENDDVAQNLKILNMLPLVQKLKQENFLLKQNLNDIKEKYKIILEELVFLKHSEGSKNGPKITMEITEIPLDQLLEESITEDVTDLCETKQIKIVDHNMFNFDNPEERDYTLLDAIVCDEIYDDNDIVDTQKEETRISEYMKLIQDERNVGFTENEKNAAIANWTTYYKHTDAMLVNKTNTDLLLEIMRSSAGVKVWAKTIENTMEYIDANAAANDSIMESETGEVSDDVESETGEVSDDVESETGEVSDDVESETGEVSDDVESETGEVNDDVESETGEVSDDVESDAEEVSDDVKSETGEVSDDVESETGKLMMT